MPFHVQTPNYGTTAASMARTVPDPHLGKRNRRPPAWPLAQVWLTTACAREAVRCRYACPQAPGQQHGKTHEHVRTPRKGDEGASGIEPTLDAPGCVFGRDQHRQRANMDIGLWRAHVPGQNDGNGDAVGCQQNAKRIAIGRPAPPCWHCRRGHRAPVEWRQVNSSRRYDHCRAAASPRRRPARN